MPVKSPAAAEAWGGAAAAPSALTHEQQRGAERALSRYKPREALDSASPFAAQPGSDSWRIGPCHPATAPVMAL